MHLGFQTYILNLQPVLLKEYALLFEALDHLQLYKELLDQANPEESHKDFKTQLQEALQKRGSDLPQYDLIETSGKDHNAVFSVQCSLTNENIQVEKSAKSIKRAEQACAEALLEKLPML